MAAFRAISTSPRAGDSPFFVIEADEYDCAFFDKRSKFVHYCPRTLILNNLEFDHADIFDDLKAIQKQFHHLVRIVPGKGKIILPENDINLKQVMAMGCWSEQELVGEQGHWQAKTERRRLAVGSLTRRRKGRRSEVGAGRRA